MASSTSVPKIHLLNSGFPGRSGRVKFLTQTGQNTVVISKNRKVSVVTEPTSTPVGAIEVDGHEIGVKRVQRPELVEFSMPEHPEQDYIVLICPQGEAYTLAAALQPDFPTHLAIGYPDPHHSERTDNHIKYSGILIVESGFDLEKVLAAASA